MLRHVIDFEDAPTKTAKCCAVYLGLHAAGCKAAKAFRIEDADKVFPQIFKSMEVEPSNNEWRGIDKTVNTRRHVRMTWQRIRDEAPHWHDRVKQFAREWEYVT